MAPDDDDDDDDNDDDDDDDDDDEDDDYMEKKAKRTDSNEIRDIKFSLLYLVEERSVVCCDILLYFWQERVDAEVRFVHHVRLEPLSSVLLHGRERCLLNEDGIFACESLHRLVQTEQTK